MGASLTSGPAGPVIEELHAGARPYGGLNKDLRPVSRLRCTLWNEGMANDVEAEALAVVIDRIRNQFPDVPSETVEAVVAMYYREYDGRPIRDFVPLLVERQAREHMESTIPRQRRPSDQTENDRQG